MGTQKSPPKSGGKKVPKMAKIIHTGNKLIYGENTHLGNIFFQFGKKGHNMVNIIHTGLN